MHSNTEFQIELKLKKESCGIHLVSDPVFSGASKWEPVQLTAFKNLHN